MGYRTLQSFFLLVFLPLLMITCSGGAPLITMGGIVFKGPVKQGLIQIYSIKQDGSLSSLLRTEKTSSNGYFLLSQPLSDVPLYFKVVGGTFVDEATGKTVSLSEEAFLSMVLIDGLAIGTHTVHITPLTTFAAQLILTLTAKGENIKNAYTYVTQKFSDLWGLPNFHLIMPSDLTDDKPETADSKNALYSLMIAGLSEQAKNLSQLHNDSSATVIDLIRALVQDAADGVFDSKDKGAPIVIGDKKIPLPPQAMTSKLSQEISHFLKNPRNRSGLEESQVKEMMNKIEGMSPSVIQVELSPSQDSLVIGLDMQKIFTAKVIGLSDQTIQWFVNGVVGGNEIVGTITQTGEYHPPAHITLSEEDVFIHAESSVMPYIYSEAKISLKKAIAISPLISALQIETQHVFSARVNLENPSLEWFVNDIPGGNNVVGTIQKTGDLKAIYTAPSILPNPSKIIVKAASAENNNLYVTSEISLFETKMSLQYEGFPGTDLVSDSEAILPGDGLDAVFKLDFDNGGVFPESIVSLSLEDASGMMLWDTISNNLVYLLGVSDNEGTSLINESDGTVSLAIENKRSMVVSVSDFDEYIRMGGEYKLKAKLLSGRTISLPFSLKESLIVDKEIFLAGIQPIYSFIRIESSGHIKAVSGLVPLELISEGNVSILGKVSANGGDGQDGGNVSGKGGMGGAGASEGGNGGRGFGQRGKGIGGGQNSLVRDLPSGGGGGGFGTQGQPANDGTGGGITYNNEELTPLEGGSGGAGGVEYEGEEDTKGGGGGGGGGAIRVNAIRNITISGFIEANGGKGGNGSIVGNVQASGGGGGSGGGILIQSESGRILVSPSGKVTAIGGISGNLGGSGGKGRIHMEGQLINQGVIDPAF